jgi:hypothetical protein
MRTALARRSNSELLRVIVGRMMRRQAWQASPRALVISLKIAVAAGPFVGGLLSVLLHRPWLVLGVRWRWTPQAGRDAGDLRGLIDQLQPLMGARRIRFMRASWPSVV